MADNISEHVDMRPGRCGGRPCVAGTRIRVWDVHVWHDLRGWSPAEIVTQFPQLKLADVYAALACYHDHREEIDREIREAEEFVERMESEARSPGLREAEKPDRSSLPTRLCRLSDEGDDSDVLALSPAERIEMMWPLTLSAWAFTGELLSEPQLSRHVVRVERRRG
jgi:uncharacterized protein (DUF433 family)